MQTACFIGCTRPPRAPLLFLGSTPPGRALGSPRHGESLIPSTPAAARSSGSPSAAYA